jgi:hypothetical protein
MHPIRLWQSRELGVGGGLQSASGNARGIGYDEYRPTESAEPGAPLAPDCRAAILLEGVLNMLVASIMALVVLGEPREAEGNGQPSAIVSQLGAPRYAEREAAAQALERLGRAALPALHAAREARDPEIRLRAAGLLKKIEIALLTQPTKVRLDFNNALLPEVTQDLTAQTGFKFALYPESGAQWRRLRVKLQNSEPVDFWKAVDQLCDVAGLQYNPELHGYVGQIQPVFAFSSVMMRTVTPVSDHGPFRVSLLGIEYRRQLTYKGAPASLGRVPPPPSPAGHEPSGKHAVAPARPAPQISAHFSADLLVAAEPRLALSQHGPIKLLEALDDRGNSLVSRSEDGHGAGRFAGGYFGANGATLRLPVALERPLVAGETIKKLRGIVPATVCSRRADPLIIPLTDSIGKTFENPELRVTVQDVKAPTNPQSNSVIELSVRARNSGATPEDPELPGFTQAQPFSRVGQQYLQFELIDSRGELIPWFQPDFDPETSRLTLTVTSSPHNTLPKVLRYYCLNRTAATIPFEFVDIPMP